MGVPLKMFSSPVGVAISQVTFLRDVHQLKLSLPIVVTDGGDGDVGEG